MKTSTMFNGLSSYVLASLLVCMFLCFACNKEEPSGGNGGDPITADFDIPIGDIFENSTINFTNTSTNATSYSWDFGDGGTSTIESPSYTYSSAGNYSVELTASNTDGESKEVSKSILVKEIPTSLTSLFSISPGPYVNQKDIMFTNNSVGATSYLWDFGDGTTSTETSPTIQYISDGTYVVKLTVFDADGQTSVSQRPLDVTKNPDLLTANIDAPSSVIYGEFFIGLANATGATSYMWDMGDGSPIIKTNITSHAYQSPGTYNVRLTISDGVNEKIFEKTITAIVENQVWSVRLSGLALAHGSGVGGFDDGVWGLIEYDVFELNSSGSVVSTVASFDNLWETGESGRIQATGYPADNSVIGNLNITRDITLDKTKLLRGYYRLDYTARLSVRHKDCGICFWGTVSMETEKTQNFTIINEGVKKGELFETDSDPGRKHFFRPQFVLSK